MADGREVDQGELLGVAKDEERARSLLRALRTLSTGPDPKLREMANGVLRGSLSAEQAFTDPEYTAALFSGADKVRRAGELRSDAEAREAGARFGEWQRARDAEQEREEKDPDGASQDRRSAERPGGPGGLRGPDQLHGLRPGNRFGPR
ncbi:hypothetical protein ACFYZI_15020 [Streptomyces griseorubiginosus]|uniref:hypothetical protein n=1 Tax=Streptomyces TaxID=1883 RepID=UPI001043E145|nr:hypothetical protein [Streptomyces sp. BK205]TCR13589.1 hypothetical protein EV578_12046 [Streptomyces sp. BK205]